MNDQRWLRASDTWLRLALRFYPADFREEMGTGVREAYRDRCRAALERGGRGALLRLWLRALVDSVRNGLGERLRPGIAWRRTGNWGRDSQLVLRRMRRSPLFVLTTVAALAAGLGAFSVVYTVVHKVLIEPLPYDRPDDLYYVWRNYTWIPLERGWVGGPDIAEMKAAGGPIQDVAGVEHDTRTLVARAGADPEEVEVIAASPNLFDLLGVRPDTGRAFAAQEVGPNHAPVAVLTHGLWRRRFNQDPSVIGSQVRIDDRAVTVIGVMGPDFRFAINSALGAPQTAELYMPLDVHVAEQSAFSGSFAALVRARPGTSMEVVASAVGAVGLSLDERYLNKRGLRLYPVAMKPDLIARVRPALLVLGASALALALVLMINLATLLLERAARREREFAISRALGADRGAIARAMVLEGTVLGLLGGACGSLLAVWGTRALVALAPLELPHRDSIAVDWSVAAIVITLGAVLGSVAGAVPALWAGRGNLGTLLGAVAVRGGGGHSRMRRGLVVAQVALAVVLLSTGGVVVRSLEGLLRSQAGFDPAGVLTFRISLSEQRYPDAAAAGAVLDRLQEEFSRLPGVSHIGATSALPLSATASQGQVTFPGAPGNTGKSDADTPMVDLIAVRPGYFEALGIDVLAGHTFARTAPAGANEAILDRTLAAQFFPAGDAIGRTVRFDDTTYAIVAVVDHARMYDLHKDGRAQVYFRSPQSAPTWALRTTREPEGLIPEVRAAVRRVDPGLPVAEVESMAALVSQSIRQQRLSATLVGGFSVAALLLATMGLFGVVAGAVTRRRHEIAVRLALGAEHGQVIRLVLREGALLVVAGLIAGVPGIYFAGRLASGTLVGVSPFDAATLAAVIAGLLAVTFVACYLPARRVAGIEPAGLLRRGD